MSKIVGPLSPSLWRPSSFSGMTTQELHYIVFRLLSEPPAANPLESQSTRAFHPIENWGYPSPMA
ncbi:hypothetical protein WCLP8_1700003 [uncultured Gammaproteobacteria bacterium]